MKFSKDEFKQLLTDTTKAVVSESTTAIVESVKTLDARLGDVEKRQARVFGQADTAHPESKAAPQFKRPNLKAKTDENETFSFARLIKATLNPMRKADPWDEARYEQFAIEESQKAMTWASGSGGGYWVAAEFLGNEFIDAYRSKVVAKACGARVLSGLQGSPIQIPKLTSGVSASWVDQNATASPADQTPGQVTLSPKICMARTQVSKMLFNTSQGTAENVIKADLAAAIGLGIDTGVLRGSGSSGQPQGLAGTGSINSPTQLGATGGTPTFDYMFEMQYQLELDNIDTSNLAWAMHPRTWNTLRLIKTYTNYTTYTMNPNVNDGPKMTLLGHPVYLTTNIPINLTKSTSTDCSAIYLCKWDDVLIGEWGAINIAATDIGGTAWANELIEIKATAYVDVGVRNVNSICYTAEVRP